MKVALLASPVTDDSLVGKTASMKAVLNIVPPLGLAYLAAVLEQRGDVVRIFDPSVGPGLEAVIAGLIEFEPAMVGLSSTTPAFAAAKQTAAVIRRKLPRALIVLGGAHASAVPESALADSAFDLAVVGEGERTLVELVEQCEAGRDFDAGRISGLVYRQGDGVRRSAPRPYLEDLDVLPFPARHLLPPLRDYSPTPASYRRLPVAVLMTSRGCPYHCTFCDRKVFGNVTRMHSPARVAAEVDDVLSRFGAAEIRFFDDTFTCDQRRVVEICERFLERRRLFPWTCLTRVNAVTPELLRLMRRAGCWQVLYGLESGDPAVLASLRKNASLEQNEQAVGWALEAGLRVRADFIVGTPAETPESLERTLALALRLGLDYAHFNKFVPYAGTELYEHLAAQGYRFEVSSLPSILDHEALPYVAPALTADGLRGFLDRANRAFYLRPRHILRRLWRTRSWPELMGQVRGASAILGLPSGTARGGCRGGRAQPAPKPG